MRILRHAEADTCVNEENNQIVCERDAAAGPSGNQVVNITTTTFPQFYSIVVDGRNNVTANFKLTLECLEGTCR